MKLNNLMVSVAAFLVLATAGSLPAQSDQPAAAPKLPFATPLHWKSTGALIAPISDATHQLVSVKDPSIVRFDNKWHIYATTADAQGHWSMVYLSFSNWSDAAQAKPYYIDSNPNLAGRLTQKRDGRFQIFLYVPSSVFAEKAWRKESL